MKTKQYRKGFLATLKEIDPLEKTLKITERKINKQDRHSDLVTDRHSDLVTDRHSDLVTDRHSDLVTDRHSDLVTDRHSDLVTDRHSDLVTDRHSDLVTDRHSDLVTDRHSDLVTDRHSDLNNLSLQVTDLTKRQLAILHHIYFNRPFKITGPNGLGLITQMGENNAKNQLKSLVKKNYIRKYFSINDGINKGSTAIVNSDKCYPLFGPSPIENPLLKDDLVTDRHSDLVTDRHSDTSSSSIIIKKKTTTKKTNIFLNNDSPELHYWKHKNITERQIKLWLKTANCDRLTMLRYLSYCRFDMVDLGLEESKPIGNVFNWFFKILEKTGGYPKPKGYKSFEEKRIEEEREVVAEQERIAKEQENLYHKKIQLERDAEFYTMLNNPDSEMYKKCFEELNNFVKKRVGKKTFEVAMRVNFDKFVEEDNA